MERHRNWLRSRPGLAILAFVLGASGLGTASALVPHHGGAGAPAAVSRAPRAPTDPALRLEDGFSGPAGASPNTGLARTLWYTDPCWTSGCGSPPQPTRYMPSHAVLDGHGHLVITATQGATGRCGAIACRFTSGRLTMLDWAAGGTPSWWQQYGTFSARLKLPVGKDLYPSFWLVGADLARVGWPAAGEIDVVDGVGASAIGEQQAQFGTPDYIAPYAGTFVLPGHQSLAGWHTYAVRWSPSGIAWSVDGRRTSFMSAARAGADWKVSFAHPFSIVFDLAVGSGMTASEAAHVLPAKMLVDWVRVVGGA